MNKEQITNDRFLMIRRLANNLKRYGSIEPPGFTGRPVHGLGDNMTYMSKANFLRVCAYLREDSPQNPHYISHLKALSLNLDTKPSARPLFLESWEKQNGDYSVSLVPYYNIDDLEGQAEEVLPLRDFSPAAQYDKLTDFINDDSFVATTDISFTELFDKVTEVASELNNNESARLFAFMTLKNFNIPCDFSIVPLFEADIVADFEQNPQKLLDAINNATNFFKEYSARLNAPAIDLAASDTQAANTEVNNGVVSESNIDTPSNVAEKSEPVQVEQADTAIMTWLREENFRYYEDIPKYLNDESLTFRDLYTRLDNGEDLRDILNGTKNLNGYVIDTIVSKMCSIYDLDKSDVFSVIQKNEKQNPVLGDNFTDSGIWDGLVVHFDFAECDLKDMAGNSYLENIDLKGDRAYEFLVQHLKADKYAFANTERGGYAKSRISIEYKDLPKDAKYAEGSMRVDLGDLEYGNRKSVYDALLYCYTLSERFLIKCEYKSLEEISYNPFSEIGKSVNNIEEYYDKLNENIQAKTELLQEFKASEEKFLELHPAIKEINAYDCKPFIYICKKEDFKGDMRKYSMDIIPNEELKNYHVLPVGRTFYYDITRITSNAPKNLKDLNDSFEIRNGLPDSMMAFTSHSSPYRMEDSRGNTHPCLSVIPSEEFNNLCMLNYLMVHDKESSEHESYHFGISGLEEIKNIKEHDKHLFNDACHDGIYIQGQHQYHDITLSFNNLPLAEVKGREGCGAFIQNNFLSLNNNPVIPLLETAAKYLDDSWLVRDLKRAEPLDYDSFPSVEKSLETWKNGKYEPEIPRRGSYDYYKECYQKFICDYANIDPQNDTLEKQCEAGIKRMIDTGRNLKQIETISKNIASSYIYGKDLVSVSETMMKLVKSPGIKDYYAKATSKSKGEAR